MRSFGLVVRIVVVALREAACCPGCCTVGFQGCCQGCCQSVAKNVAKVVAVRNKNMHAQFGVALGVRAGWSLCAGQRVVLIVTKVVAKRIWIEHTPGRPLEFAM